MGTRRGGREGGEGLLGREGGWVGWRRRTKMKAGTSGRKGRPARGMIMMRMRSDAGAKNRGRCRRGRVQDVQVSLPAQPQVRTWKVNRDAALVV